MCFLVLECITKGVTYINIVNKVYVCVHLCHDLITKNANASFISEYVQIKNHHPQLQTLTPDKFSQQFLDGTLPQFDAMVSFSSIEHSGLGRYGDQLNPWGDLITMAKVWCVIKPGL